MRHDSDSSLSSDEFYVEKILDKKIVNGEVMYYVKWEGWSSESSTWEPLDNLQNCLNKIDDFEKVRREAKKIIKDKNQPPKLEKKIELGRKKNRSEEKESDEDRENEDKDKKVEKSQDQIEGIEELDDNQLDKIVSAKEDSEGKILLQVKFKQRSDGVMPENVFVPSSILRLYYPQDMITFYESKIKFVSKK